MPTQRYRLGSDREISVRIEASAADPSQLTVTIDGASFAAERVGDGALRIEGRTIGTRVCPVADGVHVWAAGTTARFGRVSALPQRASGGSATAHEVLKAPMPGTVLKVLVAEGERFDAHAPLVIMESMKMELSLAVPHDGIVSRVHCAPGALVELDALLVEVDGIDGQGGEQDATGGAA